MEEYIIRIKKSEILNVIALILKLFSVVVFFIGLFSHATEPVIQACITFVVSAIFDFINDGFIVINNNGVSTENKGFFKWKEIELLSVNKAFVRIKRVNDKTLRFEVSLHEDRKKLSNVKKFIDSKIKNTNDEYEIEIERHRHNVENL